MKLGLIALKLRLSNTYFANRVGGAADLIQSTTKGTLTDNMAFVIPIRDDAEENTTDNGVEQRVTERFGVVIALMNDNNPKDILGLTAFDLIHDIRDELFNALVGWDLGYYGFIEYKGSRLVAIDPSMLWYQFDFSYSSMLILQDGYGVLEYRFVSDRQDTSSLPDLNTVYSEYVMSPSTKWDDLLKVLCMEGTHLPLDATAPDMAQLIDLSKPYKGGFYKGFGIGFDVYRIND